MRIFLEIVEIYKLHFSFLPLLRSTFLIYEMKKKKRKKFNILKISKAASRQAEINEHGKLISFRPTRAMKSIKEYSRKKFKKEDINED